MLSQVESCFLVYRSGPMGPSLLGSRDSDPVSLTIPKADAGLGELVAQHEEGSEQAQLTVNAHRARTHVGIVAEAPRLRGDIGAERHPVAPGEVVALGRAERHAPVDDI